MTPRERAEAALNYLKPDRVPVDLNLTYSALKKLTKYLEVDINDDPVPNTAMEAILSNELINKLEIDFTSIKFGGRKQNKGKIPERIIDNWGIERKLVNQKYGQYYEVLEHPFKNLKLKDIENYNWPLPPSREEVYQLSEEARYMYYNTDLALVGRFGGPTLETALDLMGMENYLICLISDPELINALLKKISSIIIETDLLGIEAAGKYLSIMKVSGEDLGMQNMPLYPPYIFKERILPILKLRWNKVHTKLDEVGSNAKVMLHSCGAIQSFIPSLIESGIEVLDPIQPLATGMSPSVLQSKFGGKIVFHGGIDIQELLPTGKPEKVFQETTKVLKEFKAENGGFILAPSHAVQADVPPENIIAMIEAAKNYKCL